MGHRALVAYQRADGRFDVHFSHKGADDLLLCNEISETTPLGGEASSSEFTNAFINHLEETSNGRAGGELTRPQEPTVVEAEPKKTEMAMPEVCSYLTTYKRGIEALYVVTRDFEVSGFQCLHVGLDDEYHGSILVSPRWHDGEPVGMQQTRGWFNGIEQTLSNLITDGVLSGSDATNRLLEQTLTRMQDQLEQRVLAHSPAVPSRYYTEYIPAFLRPVSIRYEDKTVTVSSFKNYDPWELPDDFPDPALAKQPGSNKQPGLSMF